MKVCAVVVTRNRKALLLDCLQAICMQVQPVDAIFLIDNASNDGTDVFLYQAGYLPSPMPKNAAGSIWYSQKDFTLSYSGGRISMCYTRLPENIGGAGGFQKGLKQAFERGYDWMWVMDDDTVASDSALKNLLAHSRRPGIGFVCSKVLWTDCSVHIMNIPQVSPLVNATPFNAADDVGVILVNACSFVSVLIGRQAVSKIGYPIGDFFIWLDDIEYTSRIVLSGFLGVYTKDSIVNHKTSMNQAAAPGVDSIDKAWKYFYQTRNQIYLIRKRAVGLKRYASLVFFLWSSTQSVLERIDGKFVFMKHILKGFVAGLIFEPTIEKASGASN